MKRAVIDVGSNSIRLLLESKLNKKINTTQLATGLAIDGYLQKDAMLRTSRAIKEFYDDAISNGSKKVYVFATEAVRSAKNREDFITLMREKYQIDVRVLNEEEEARAGYLGATQGGRACIIDIGGASTEIVIGEKDKIIYSKSLAIGIVRLKDLCGQDVDKLRKYIKSKIKEYGNIGKIDYAVAIGGTASTMASVLLGGFTREKVHNYRLTRKEIGQVLEIIVNAPDKNAIKGLPQMRATVIIGGIILLDEILEMLNINEIIVSENDNMEGFLKMLDSESLI